MSTKGLRHHMVMNSYHHRWASRRAIGAAKQLTSKDAVLVPVKKGKRITKSSSNKNSLSTSQSTPLSTSSTGNGSFDAFFSQTFGDKSSPSPSSSKSALKKSIRQTIYTPQLWFGELSAMAANHDDFQGLEKDDSNNDIEFKPIHAYFAPLDLPAGSIHNTIAHIFLAENLWMKRYTNVPPKQELHDLWTTSDPASSPHWSHFMSKILQLPVIDTSTTSSIPFDEEYLSNLPSIFTPQDKTALINNTILLTKTLSPAQKQFQLIKILDLTLDEQDQLAQKMLSHLGLHLDAQCTDWIELIRGTSEPDLFNELSYFDSSYIPPSGQDITKDDFITDKSKLNNLQRLVALNHLFMHTTHHRSQVITAANQFTGESTTVDLTAFLPEWTNIHAKAFRWA